MAAKRKKPAKPATRKKTTRKKPAKKLDVTDCDQIEGLTPRQAAWVFWYTCDGDTLFNGAAAARKAGYSGTDNQLAGVGYGNRRKSHIIAAVNKRLMELYGNAGVSVDKVLMDIEHTRQMALKAGNHSAALRASELHGKYMSMWIERVEHVHTIEDVGTDELIALANQLAGKVDGLNLNGAAANDGPAESAAADTEGNRSEDRAEGTG